VLLFIVEGNSGARMRTGPREQFRESIEAWTTFDHGRSNGVGEIPEGRELFRVF
jgi:hypothetical protein